MIFLTKLITLLTLSWITIYTYFCIPLVSLLSTPDLTPNFSESNYIYLYHKCYKLCG